MAPWSYKLLSFLEGLPVPWPDTWIDPRQDPALA